MERRGLTLLVGLGLGLVGLASPVAAAPTPKPVASLAVTASSTSLDRGERQLSLTMDTTNVVHCAVAAKPAAAGFPKVDLDCGSGRVVNLRLPVNATAKAISYTLTVSASPLAPAKAPKAVAVKVTQQPAYRAAFYGDSIEHQVYPLAADMLAATGKAVSTAWTFPGMSYCGAWPTIASQLKTFKPELVVLQFTGTSYNDCAKAYGADHSTAWFTRYRADLEKGITALAKAGVTAIKLDQGPVSKLESPWMGQVRDLYDAIAAAHPGLVTQVTPGAAVEGPGRSWVRYLPCLADEITSGQCTGTPNGGQGTIVVRSPDNFHLCAETPADPFASTCPSYSSGPVRYAGALVAPILTSWGLSPVPVYLP